MQNADLLSAYFIIGYGRENLVRNKVATPQHTKMYERSSLSDVLVQNLPAGTIFYFFSAGTGAATTIFLSIRRVTLLSTSIRRVVSSTFFTTA